MSPQQRRGPEKGRKVTADQRVRFWPTAKAYRALKQPPPQKFCRPIEIWG